jgi:hypothetical protein
MDAKKQIAWLVFGILATVGAGTATGNPIVTIDDSTDTIIGTLQTDTGTSGCKFGGNQQEPHSCQIDLPDGSLPGPGPSGKDFVEVLFTEGANGPLSDVFFLALAGGGQPPNLIFQSDCDGSNSDPLCDLGSSFSNPVSIVEDGTFQDITALIAQGLGIDLPAGFQVLVRSDVEPKTVSEPVTLALLGLALLAGALVRRQRD